MIPITLRHKKATIEAPVPPSWSNDYYVDFDGVNEFLTIDNPSFSSDTASGGRTFAMWMRFDVNEASGVDILFRMIDQSTSTYNGFFDMRLVYGGTDVLAIQRRVENGSTFAPASLIAGTTSLVAGNKYLLAIATDGTKYYSWVNGSIDINGSSTGGGLWWGDLGMGAGGSLPVESSVAASQVGSVPLNGGISEMYMFNKKLSNTEMTELYNSGTELDPSTTTFAANLDGYWRMGDGDVYPIIQDNVNSDDYTMTNMESGDIVNGNL